MVTINQKMYREWAAMQDDLPLFFQPWWLDIVNAHLDWNAVIVQNDKSGNIEGVLPFRIVRRWKLLRSIDNPMLTPFNGPWLVYPKELSRVAHYSFEMRVLDQLARAIPEVFYYEQRCHYQFQNWLPFYHLGFRQTTRYSYVLEDIRDPMTVWAAMKKTHQRTINKEKKEFTFEQSTDIDLLFDLVIEVFIKQGKKNPLKRNIVKQLYQAAEERGCTQIFVAKNIKSGLIEGAIWLVNDQQSTYLLATGRRNDSSGGAVTTLIWHAIQFYADKGLAFDFEGSMLKGVEAFFRRFGGKRKPYFRLMKGSTLLMKN